MAMKQVEVNGVVLEFEESMLIKQKIKVGDNVQLIMKRSYSEELVLYPGVVIQILPYEDEMPVVEVLYIDYGYSEIDVKRCVVTNKPDKGTKIIKTADPNFLPFTKERALDLLDRDIEKKESALKEAQAKKDYFLKYYNKYFEEVQEVTE